MRLIDDWRWLLNKAWSIRLAIIGATLGAVEMALPLFSDSIPRGVFLGLSMFATVGGAVARLIDQPKMRE